ncbi:ciliary microtubule inner protein 2C-like [Ptychodera flava]|uniref:ciliary microtubule inner protein 2C-like n=1 Tax=Ptychodera flava TaxID=63121 RepID=UPI00396A2226
MSRSAGTLITTHNATYIPPRLMPGYKGHCPTTKFDYGETYGHATAKYFQDYRSATLNNSKSNYSTGGQFPTIYSHNPDLVMSARDRTRERYRTAPKYQLSNLQYDREEDLSKFDTLAQQHREHYKDRTGTMQRVDYFMLPVKAEEQFKKQSAYLIQLSQSLDSAHRPNVPIGIQRRLLGKYLPKSSVRDRAMRDVHFERR